MQSFSQNITIPSVHIQNIFGQFDKHIKLIEKQYHVAVVLRDDTLKIVGEEGLVSKATDVINALLKIAEQGDTVTEQNVLYALSLNKTGEVHNLYELNKDDQVICHTINGKPIKAKTLGQKKYLDAIDKNMIVFGVGPAGTGKTYLAMAKAITAFKNNEVNRIILTRPAIEAGEKLGFLPGDFPLCARTSAYKSWRRMRVISTDAPNRFRRSDISREAFSLNL